MLSVVATPIGNLEDLSPRALRTLRECDLVFAEDTRRTLKLLSHFGLSKPVRRYADDLPRAVEEALGALEAGKKVALVSDGGMPVVSDPGRRLVAKARRRGLPATVIPGPSAVEAAVAGSGLPGGSYLFLGFLPRGPGKRRKALEAARDLGATAVIYESPRRAASLLAAAEEVYGPEAQAALARELTKLHEEWRYGALGALRREIEGRGKLLGEVVVLLHPRAPEGP